MFRYYLLLGFRSLRRNPALTLLMIVTLAIGVAASISTLTILHVMSGQADVLFNGMVATLPHVKSGKLKLLAVSSDARVASLAGIPTVAEATGMRDFKTGTYQGVLAPAGTPAPIVAKLQVEIARIAALPDVKEKLVALGADPVLNTPAQFADWIKSENAKWAAVVKKANLKVQ